MSKFEAVFFYVMAVLFAALMLGPFVQYFINKWEL
tara:strand:- start:318 stop:422 length:105 start_codon:yes stop_codon:yes gene_type:complete